MEIDEEYKVFNQNEKRRINITLLVYGFVRSFIKYGISLCLIIVSIGVFRLALFDISKDTFAITNYGFAIMAAYTSICFSWTRNLDSKKEEEEIIKINSIAHRSLYSGITFLLGSLLKYIIIQNKGFIFLGNHNLTPTVQLLALASIAYAVLLFCIVSIQLLAIIDEMRKKKHKEKLEYELAGGKMKKDLAELTQEVNTLMAEIEEKKKKHVL